MSVIQVNNYYAEWIPSGTPDQAGTGRIVIRGAQKMTELHWLSNLHADDFRALLHLLQTEKPLYWDSNVNSLRTAHPQSLDAEPVGEQEG